MCRYKKFVIVVTLSQALVIAVVLVWYAYQEFVLSNFDAFLSAQLALSIANPVVRFLIVITRVRAWIWALAGLPFGGQVGQSAFALQGLLFMTLLDFILGPLSTLALLLKAAPGVFPRLRCSLSSAETESAGTGSDDSR